MTLTVEVEREKDLEQFDIPVEVDNYIFSDRWLFDIDAQANSIVQKTPLLKTGLCLQPGDQITVNVHPLDFWSLTAGDLSLNMTATGRRSDGTFGHRNLSRFNHNFQYGGLVGTLDGGKTFFPVGTHLQMTALNAGNLSFAFWDYTPGDNKGLIRAYVKVVRDGITITYPSNVSSDVIDLGQLKNLSSVKTKVKFDPNTCIWAKAQCKLEPAPIIDQGSGLIKTEAGKKYNLQVTVNPGTAGYKNTFGMFPIDPDGSINGVKPGDPTYAETAVRNRIQIPDYQENSLKETFKFQLLGGSNYEIFFIANGTPDEFLIKDPKNEDIATPNAYFMSVAANPDKIEHIRPLKGTEDTYGLEDLYGGGDQDFDDMTVQLKIISVENDTTQSEQSDPNGNNMTTMTENDCPLYPLCKLSQLSN